MKESYYMSESFKDWLKRHDIAQMSEETRKMLEDADEDISFEDNKEAFK